MGLFGKPHRHDDGIKGCWCNSLTEGKTKSLSKKIGLVRRRPSTPPPATKKQVEPEFTYYRLWIEYGNGQNWCVERDTVDEVIDAISEDDVKTYEIIRFCGNKIRKEDLCA